MLLYRKGVLHLSYRREFDFGDLGLVRIIRKELQLFRHSNQLCQ